MKKLMIAAAVAAGIAGSGYCIESANIVGYTMIAIPTGYSLFTPAFQGVGDTNFDLNTVEVLDANGDPLDGSYNEIQLQKMGTNNGAYLNDVYSYDSDDGWNIEYTPLTGENAVTFYNGEGISVNNTTGGMIYFKIAGEVDLVCQNVINTGYSLWGGASPVEFKLSDVVVTDLNGDALDGSYNEIQLQKMGTDNGAYLDTIYSYDSDDGWNNEYVPLDDTVTLAPGEGISVNNTTGYQVIFTIPSPTASN